MADSLIAAFQEILAERLKPATDGYRRRKIYLATENTCDAGAEPVCSYTLSIADARRILSALKLGVRK
jgi:hypothetical protein